MFFIIRYDTLYHTFLPLPRALAILNSVKSTRLNVAHGEHAILLRDFEAKYDDMVEYLRLIDQVIGDLQIDEAIAEKVATQIEESLFSFFKKDNEVRMAVMEIHRQVAKRQVASCIFINACLALFFIPTNLST